MMHKLKVSIKVPDKESDAARIKKLVTEFKQYLAQLEVVKAKEMPKYKRQCEKMIDLAGEIDAILRNE